YNKRLVSMDKEVKVLDPHGEYCGISRGIDNMGRLVVECGDGTVKNVDAGEVSVRGLYGYV
ncbi:MAG: biotin--[acetyl-CoA-carboxylase] ligase, partial [Lachnospiraceae bacterium]|nr:biotin--[acetyl-CoA-carboxylase] ligase [Lachnospiraceae bacterium]